MDKLMFTASDGVLLEVDSPAYEFLRILSDVGKHSRDHLCNELGGGFRSY